MHFQLNTNNLSAASMTGSVWIAFSIYLLRDLVWWRGYYLHLGLVEKWIKKIDPHFVICGWPVTEKGKNGG